MSSQERYLKSPDGTTIWAEAIGNPSKPHIVFIHGLASIDPKLWAGTSPEIPAVLEGWEVERVMKLLDSEDRSIRQQAGTLSTPHLTVF